jgi:long-chain acyl-CoA synthetase
MSANWPKLSISEVNAALTAPGAPFEMAQVTINGRAQRVFKNAPPTLRDLFHACRQNFGARTFHVFENERVSFEMFARASAQLAHWLIKAGVRKGDRVAIIMRNYPEWPVSFFGAVLAGAVATPLNAWLTAEELEYALNDCGAAIAIVDDERYGRLATRVHDLPQLEKLVVVRDPTAGADPLHLSFEAIAGTSADWADLPDQPLPDVPLQPEDVASILYTSGTTGNSKGAIQTHRNSTVSLFCAQFAVARNFLRRGEPVPAPDPNVQRAVLLSVPFFHTTGCHAVLIPALATGTKIVTSRKFDALEALKLIEREKITSAGGVPTIAWQILEHPDAGKYDLSSLESFSYGGAPAATELVRKISKTKALPGIGWGMTETTSTFTSNSAEDYQAKPESAGPTPPVNDMKVVDGQGRALGPNEVGELWVRGPGVISAYWNKPQANAETFVDGWLKTGDIARIDEDGFLYIVDRKKDMIIRGGENIYCVEVEDVLQAHPAVTDAALVGLAHRTLGEEPAAVVTIKPDAVVSEADLRAHVAAHLAAFKAPVKIIFMNEPLPRNANGKILKRDLKKLFEA